MGVIELKYYVKIKYNAFNLDSVEIRNSLRIYR